MVAQSKHDLAAEAFISDPDSALNELAKLVKDLEANKGVLSDWMSNKPQKSAPLVSMGPGGIGNYTQKEIVYVKPLNLRKSVRALLGRVAKS